jgi:hypothetical protein
VRLDAQSEARRRARRTAGARDPVALPRLRLDIGERAARARLARLEYRRHAQERSRAMTKREAGEIAEAITLIETGRATIAILRLRRLLSDTGHPAPAHINADMRPPTPGIDHKESNHGTPNDDTSG